MTQNIEQELSSNARVQSLCQALAMCSDDEQLMLRFLRDLLSFSEIQQAANRWSAAQLLLKGKSQPEVARELSMSTKTVSSVAKWAKGHEGRGGYKEVFERLQDADPEMSNQR